MDYVHERVANALVSLEYRIDPQEILVPVGSDGAVFYHLLRHRWTQMGREQEDQLANALHATSRTGEIDDAKLSKLVSAASSSGKAIYGLDIRTKTGALGSMLRSRIDPDIGFFYTVLFDPGSYADIRASSEELTDEDRTHIYWFHSIRQEGNILVYNLTHDIIANFDNVKEIKILLDQL